MPLKYIRTNYISPQPCHPDGNKKRRQSKSVENRPDILEKDFKNIALSWWENYYDDWPETKLAALGNIIIREAVKTKTGRKKVEALIEEFENLSLLAIKTAGQRIIFTNTLVLTN